MPFVLLAALATLFAVLASPAAAAPIGSDGKIYACYKVKGKPKGAMRILPRAKARCKRGERKVAWIAASVSGQTGASGQDGSGSQGSAGAAGSTGTAGSAGANGSDGSTVEAKVSSLSLKVDGLEDVLEGVNKGDLTGVFDKLSDVGEGDLDGVLDKLEGVTEGELTDAVDASELVDDLCDQTDALTTQVNLLEGVIEDLGLDVIGSLDILDTLNLLGGPLGMPTLPGELDPLPCPSA